MKYVLTLFCTCLLLSCSGKAPPAEEVSPVVETVTYPSGKENLRGFLAHPAGEGRFPGLLLIHGDYGLTDWVKEQTKRLADRGYVVLAVDLYRGAVVSNLEDAHIMDRGLPEDRVARDLQAAVDYLTGRKDVRADTLGVVGFDMGGGYALDAAIGDPRLRAVVMCYGRLTTDAKLLAPLRASVFAIFAEKDKGISPETIEQFRAAMNKTGKRLTIRVYTECGHGFLDPANWAMYGAPPADDIKDAWNLIDNYLAGELKH